MAELSADGKLLATACGASEDWRPSEIWPSRKTQSNGNVKATVGYSRVWDLMTSAPVTEPLAHQKAVFDIGFSPDTSRVVTGSEDQTARVWDARTGKPLTEPMHHTAPVVSTRFNAGGTRILAVAGGVTIWDLNGNPIASCATGAIAAKYTPEAGLIVAVFEGSGGEDAHFADTQVVDAATGKEIGKPIGGAGSSATSLSFDRGSKRLLETFVPRNSNKEDAGGLQEIDLTNLDADPSPFPGEENIPVRCAVLTPEERRILAGLPDHTVRLWDRYDSERKPQMVPVGLPGEPVYLEFEPSGGQFIVLSSDYQSEGEATERTWVQFWRRTMPQRSEVTHVPQTALPTQAVVREGNDPSQAEVLTDTSRDEKRLVKIDASGTVRVYDSATGKPLGEPMKHQGPVQSAQFSPDGKRVVTASSDKASRLWDAEGGRPLGKPMNHDGSVNSAQFSPDGQRVVIASDDKTARLWDAATGKPLGEPMKHQGPVQSAQFSPDGQRVVTASQDKTARLWDAATGKSIGKPMKHEDEVYSARFSPDGQRVVTASKDKTARLWDAATGKPLGEPMKHQGPVQSAQFSPDGQRVVTASSDKTARLWDAEGGRPLGKPMNHDGSVNSAQFSPDGQRVVTSSEDRTARLWDATMCTPLGEPMKHQSPVQSAQFSPDGQRVVTASQDKTARLWDAATGKSIGKPMKHEDEVYSAQFSPDGQRVVTASKNKTARLWDAAAGKPLGVPIKQAEQYGGFFGMQTARFSNDGRLIATGEGGDFRIAKGMARVWDASTGTPVTAPLIHDLAVTSVAFSSDNERLATIEVPIPKMNSSKARIWDVKSGQPLSDVMAHNTMTFFAEFNNERTRLIQVCEGEEEAAATREIVDIGFPAHGAVPTWLPRLAEAVAGKRLNEETGVIEDIPDQWNSIEALRTELASLNGDEPFTLFGRWFLADTINRTISPYSKVTVRSYVEEWIKSGDDSAMNDAEEMVVGNKELRDRVIARRSQK